MRLAVLLAVAVLPAAILSVASAVEAYQRSVALSRDSLMQTAVVVARRIETAVADMRRLAEVAAGLPSVTDPGACSLALGAIVRTATLEAGGLIYDQSGKVVCSVGTFGEEAAAARLSPGDFVVHGKRLAIGVKVADTPLTLVISEPAEYLSGGLWSPARTDWSTVAVLTTGWRALVLSAGDVENWRPQNPTVDRPGMIRPELLSYESEADVPFLYAVVPVMNTPLFVTAAASQSRLIERSRAALYGGILSPLAMLALAAIAAWVGVDRLVTRWIVYLRRVTELYGAGRSSVRAVKIRNAPGELAALGEAFNRMAETVAERTDTAQALANARGALLRELHHRVKNNFQLVASLIKLKKRDLPRDQAEVLRFTEERVAAIAAAYRVAYAEGEIGPVYLRELLVELVAGLTNAAGLPTTLVTIDVPPGAPSLDLDRAVPYALLLTELIAGSLVTSRDPGAPIRVAIIRESEGFVTQIDTSALENGLAPGGPLSDRLVKAFLAQLSARMEGVQAARLHIFVPSGATLAPHQVDGEGAPA